MYDSSNIELPMSVDSYEDFNSVDTNSDFSQFVKTHDVICKSIKYKCRKYDVGDLVVLSRSDCNEFEVGLIKLILVRRKTVILVVRRYSVIGTDRGFFKSDSYQSNLEAININLLFDSYPLHKKGTETKFVFVCHHHLSFS